MKEWRKDARCKGRTKIFYSELEVDKIIAKAMCRSCNVKNECLSEALVLNEEDGIWGGETERGRKKLRNYYVTFVVRTDKSVS